MIIKPENPEKLIEKLRSAPLVLYGMGGAGMRIAKWCSDNGVSFVFADKNAEAKKAETSETVLAPFEINEKYPTANIVVASIIYYNDIADELKKIGIDEERILSYRIFMPGNIMWSDLDDNIDWELMRFRVEMFSEWIGDEVRSVADYGAGREWLRQYLAPDVRYYPIDYIRRNEGTILCDLNTGIFPDLYVDVSICSGVLEFISTAEALLGHVCAHSEKMVILSYLGIEHFPDIEGRRASAYVSDLSEADIVDIMEKGGFVLKKKVPDPVNKACTVYLFEVGNHS